MKGLPQTTATTAIVCLFEWVLLRSSSQSKLKCRSIKFQCTRYRVSLRNANQIKKMAPILYVTSAGEENRLYKAE